MNKPIADNLKFTAIGNRRGFAIILVAALAGLLFLLGASLVAISQLQRAAANYDQRTRLARDHARAALDIAIGELQLRAGPDTSVTFLADFERSPLEDFRFPTPPTEGGLQSPFWMLVHDKPGEEPKALVTKPTDGTFEWRSSEGEDVSYSMPDQSTVPYDDWVTLIGPNSVKAESEAPEDADDQQLLEVVVPKERIDVVGLQGFGATDEQPVGNYAYWVGDLGTKASYALYDNADKTLHGDYSDDDRRDRLRQLRATSTDFGSIVDQDYSFTNEGDPENPDDDVEEYPNRDRIDAFTNDFQFRDRYGSADNKERFLIGLDEESDNTEQPREVSLYFHDFTPLSKGLLTNSAAGGFKTDLSKRTAPDTEYETKYLPYVELAATASPIFNGYDEATFGITPASVDTPVIMPVLTQFNLNYSVYLKRIDDNSADLYVSFNSALEFWNPFTSRLAAEAIRIEIAKLPPLSLTWETESVPFWRDDLDDVALPLFSIPATVDGEASWRPGEIAAFSGPPSLIEYDPPGAGEVPMVFPLVFGPSLLGEKAARVEENVARITSAGKFKEADLESLEIVMSFRDDDAALVNPSIELTVYPATGDTPLAIYSIEPTYSLSNASIANVFSIAADDETQAAGNPRFGFSWEITDAVLPKSASYSPFETSISPGALLDFETSASSAKNKGTLFADAKLQILGFNPSNFEDPDAVDYLPPPTYDYSVLQLPKQEIVSISQLSNAYSSDLDPDLVPIGSPDSDPTSDRNRFFDKTFFSTVPQLVGEDDDWEVFKALPNSGYTPKPDASKNDLRDVASAEHLYAHGMFNVHSTSIEAWAAMLRASPASRSTYWKQRFEEREDIAAEAAKTQPDGTGDGNNELEQELYLFFNYPQSAEDVYDFDFVPATDAANYGLPEKRASMRNGMFALTEAQVKQLATQIVKNVRLRVQGSAPYDLVSNGPFISMEDFVNSGVLENAIADMASPSLNPLWAEPGSARQFSQVTILNMLAPYLSVRSDTFLVRAYGDAVNPADPNEIWAKAYCEAIVQRTHAMHADSSLGRKMEVVAFRWLAPSEI